ncbi:MAG TPA: hypothetical protein ENG80_04830 [Nitrospirae bacterium]|nr:hypothetical protein [Nitrospirota bacterium]HDH51183.1 hypothetical protein [Nitrospirota bacterium]
MPEEAEELYDSAQDAYKAGGSLKALALCEKALNIDPDNPKYRSFHGVCIAYERGAVKEAISLCRKTLKEEPQKTYNHLNLGRVYLRCGLRLKATEIFREGLKIEKNPEIIAELQTLGLRKKPVIPSLPRDHFLNKYLGLILSRLGLR